MDNNSPAPEADKKSFFTRSIDRIISSWNYCAKGVWSDPRKTTGVKAIKILNLSVNSFFDRGLQIKSMALTYSTVLAIVPAIALLVAIGRGFGLQDTIMSELYIMFPSQHKVLSTFLTFVDSYLTNATQGLFVGVGILVLLWTVISLLSSIEDAFNSIWDVVSQRTFFQKLTDYIAICLLIPILLICSSGISLFMTTTIQDALYFPFLTPLINWTLELMPLFLSWIAFTLSYYMVPNARIRFKYAAAAGAFASIGFYILQWLFLNGQIYVSKYNAIYGSFAFLPLMLVWLQLTWLLLLTGCVLTYALQNVLTFNFLGDEGEISLNARRNIAVIIMAVVARRFDSRRAPLSQTQIATRYSLPIRLVGKAVAQLKSVGLVYDVEGKDHTILIAPARETADMTVADVTDAIDNAGDSFISPEYTKQYAGLIGMIGDMEKKALESFRDTLLTELPLPEDGSTEESES